MRSIGRKVRAPSGETHPVETPDSYVHRMSPACGVEPDTSENDAPPDAEMGAHRPRITASQPESIAPDSGSK